MPKNIILVTLSLLIVLFVGYFIYVNLLPNRLVKDDKKSPFSKLTTSSKNSEENLEEAVMKKYKDDPYGLLDFKYAWGVINLYPDIPWDYETTPFLSIVMDIDEQEDTLLLQVSMPETMPLYNQKIEVKTFCSKNNTYVYDEGTNRITFGDLEFYQELKVGSTLLTYCGDEKCEKVGWLCKVHK